MRRTARNTAIALAASAALVGATASTAAAQPQQRGLVNVNVSEIDVETGDILSNILNENNVAVGVAANLVAQVCPALSVGNVAVLATQAVRGGSVDQDVDCDSDGDQETNLTFDQVT
ncbi:hypothetical protein [Blastococcus sp. SYSU DS0973]